VGDDEEERRSKESHTCAECRGWIPDPGWEDYRIAAVYNDHSLPLPSARDAFELLRSQRQVVITYFKFCEHCWALQRPRYGNFTIGVQDLVKVEWSPGLAGHWFPWARLPDTMDSAALCLAVCDRDSVEYSLNAVVNGLKWRKAVLTNRGLISADIACRIDVGLSLLNAFIAGAPPRPSDANDGAEDDSDDFD